MRKWILPALMGLGFLLGLGITLYPAVSNYLLEKNQSTAMQGYIEEQEKVPDEVSERLKQEAREYNEKLREGTVVLTDPFDPEAGWGWIDGLSGDSIHQSIFACLPWNQ